MNNLAICKFGWNWNWREMFDFDFFFIIILSFRDARTREDLFHGRGNCFV